MKLLIALSLSLAAPLCADVVMTAQQESPMGSAPTTSTFYISPKAVRMEAAIQGAAQTVIYRKESDSFVILDATEKKFSEMTAEDMGAMAAKITEAMKQMESQLEGLPPEQQAMVRKMMQGQDGGVEAAKAEYKKEASGVKVGAWTTDHYSVMRDGEKTGEIWTAPAEKLGMSAAELATLKAMSEFSAKTMRQLGMGAQVLPLDDAQIGGVPVKNVVIANGAPVSQLTVTSVEKKELPASTFETPAGYTKRDLMPR